MNKTITLTLLLWVSTFYLAHSQYTGSGGTYMNVLKVPSLDSSPQYIYVNTNIPATDAPAPQIQITGYMYALSNRALKLTLSWYYYNGQFLWTQFHSDLGYQRPSRIRLGTYSKNGNNYIRIELANDGVYWSNYTFSATDRADFSGYYRDWAYAEGEMPIGTAQITQVSLQENVFIQGNLGIGTTNLTEKLTVNGKIRAREIKVETANWPDYVFDQDYKILGLNELDAYIKANKHLPEVPPAKEVEANGIALGEMVKLQQKKIEELTIHLIEKDKEIVVLRKDFISIKQFVEQMAKGNQKLKTSPK